MPGITMMMEWTPQHAGRWLYHCHFQGHISTDERLPMLTQPMAAQSSEPKVATGAHAEHDAMGGMRDMAALVLMINVKATASAPKPTASAAPRKLDLVIEPNAAGGKRELSPAPCVMETRL